MKRLFATLWKPATFVAALLPALATSFALATGCGGYVSVSDGVGQDGGTPAGRCGQSCDGECIGTRCLVTLASGQDEPLEIAVDSTHVYWTNAGDGRVMKVAIDGGAPVAIASGPPPAIGVAVDDKNAYWTNFEGLTTVPLPGGTPTKLMTGCCGGPVVVDGANLFTISFGGGIVGSSGLVKLPTAGGGFTFLGEDAGVFAVQGKYVFWADLDGIGIAKTPTSGGTAMGLAPMHSVNSLAADADGVYFSTGDAVMTVGLSGGTPVTLASGQDNADHVAVDGNSLYWAVHSSTDRTLMKSTKTGEHPIALASGQNGIADIAVDATSVYWTNRGSGTVMKLTPK